MAERDREQFRAIELERLAKKLCKVFGEDDTDRRYIPFSSNEGSWSVMNRQSFPFCMPLPPGLDTRRVATDMCHVLNGEAILDHGMDVAGLLDEFHRLILVECPEYLSIVRYWQDEGISDPAVQDRLMRGAADVLGVVCALRA